MAAAPRPAADRRPDRPDAGAGALERWLPTPLLKGSALLHLAALGLLVAAPRHWRWALGAAVADHLAMLSASLSPRSPLLGPLLTRLPPGAADRGDVALTLDDGPDPEVTPRVLDLLDRASARASFFLVGRRAAAHPTLAREIARRGHRVENHTWSHRHHFAFHGPRGLGREVDRAQELLADLTGRPPAWFRPPAGMRNPLLAGVLAERGLGLASWTRRGFDRVSRDPGRVTRRLTRHLASGDVLLLHDAGTPRSQNGAPVVLEALPALLDTLRTRGLRAVPLPEPRR